ncbi:WbqC family protein [Streptomyces sp. NBC_01498]|uniref:WbqC family protein n=1 Tax=Streptomyces sp. NBC_01498 TaxID=2975870 RepID=UPI002E7B8496|nr:WbqC family protein [Streptomyces sp. NBC_01498]
MVLNDAQFTPRDFQHRARLRTLDEPGRRQWLTIPTHLPHRRPTLIRDALIDDPGRARRKTAGTLRQYYGASPYWPALARSLAPVPDAHGTGRIATVADVSTRALLGRLGWQGKIHTAAASRPDWAATSGSPISAPSRVPARTCAEPAA